ncbi:hypothetical protein [Polaromonas sp. CG9_12]|nr:hypothetical protein [Polaromonas sp. CG9_12]
MLQERGQVNCISLMLAAGPDPAAAGRRMAVFGQVKNGVGEVS